MQPQCWNGGLWSEQVEVGSTGQQCSRKSTSLLAYTQEHLRKNMLSRVFIISTGEWVLVQVDTRPQRC